MKKLKVTKERDINGFNWIIVYVFDNKIKQYKCIKALSFLPHVPENSTKSYKNVLAEAMAIVEEIEKPKFTETSEIIYETKEKDIQPIDYFMAANPKNENQ